jgi:hypothetical protein
VRSLGCLQERRVGPGPVALQVATGDAQVFRWPKGAGGLEGVHRLGHGLPGRPDHPAAQRSAPNEVDHRHRRAAHADLIPFDAYLVDLRSAAGIEAAVFQRGEQGVRRQRLRLDPDLSQAPVCASFPPVAVIHPHTPQAATGAFPPPSHGRRCHEDAFRPRIEMEAPAWISPKGLAPHAVGGPYSR